MPYATAADVRARFPAIDGTYSDALLTGLIARFEDIAERYCGVAYLPRTLTERFVVPAGQVWRDLNLSWPEVTAISVFTIDGAAVLNYTRDQTAGRIVGAFLYGSAWSGSAVVITYTHGLTAPPTAIVDACLWYVRSSAKSETSGTSRDVIAQHGPDGVVTRFSTPDWDDERPTGFNEVDTLLNSVTDRRIGFA